MLLIGRIYLLPLSLGQGAEISSKENLKKCVREMEFMGRMSEGLALRSILPTEVNS